MNAAKARAIDLWKRMSFPDYLRARFSDTHRYLIIWIITGLACGLVAVLFHKSINGLFHFLFGTAQELGGERAWLVLLLIGLLPPVGGLITGVLLHHVAPTAAGSGMPQTKARYYRDFGFFRLREAVARFVLGTVSVGFGMSLGREGPTVHICSALASKIGQWFGLAKQRVQAMVPLGMGAGIAAAFHAPMAAVFFVFEELLGDFSGKSFFGIFIAVVIASVVQRLMTGEHPAFDIELGTIQTDWWMLLAVPLGILSAFLGRLFVYSLLETRQRFKDNQSVPRWLQPALGGIGVSIAGLVVFQLTGGKLGVFGIGYTDLNDALNGRTLMLLAVVALFVGKFIATVLAYGAGNSGGLFAPSLFLGGMLGATVGLIGQHIFNYDDHVVGAMALLGMGSFFAAVIRAPMTSIVIIWEMTGLYSLILPLMAGNILAWIIAQRLHPIPLYDALLLQDKISLKKMPSYQGDRDWRNLPVSTIMTFDPVSVSTQERLDEVYARLNRNGLKHHAYPVVGADGALAGMITHHEIAEHVTTQPQAGVAEFLPDRKLVTLTPEMSIREVARILVVEDVMQAPVVSAADPTRVLGIVTLHDIARQQNQIDDAIGR